MVLFPFNKRAQLPFNNIKAFTEWKKPFYGNSEGSM